MKIRLLVVSIMLLLPFVLFADYVVLKNGDRYTGALLGASSQFVMMQINDSTSIRIPQIQIDSLYFRHADMVYTLSGEEIKCKILNEQFPVLQIVTAEGLRELRILDLKRYFHNQADSLYLTVLPPTGNAFNNEKSIIVKSETRLGSFSISLTGGLVNPPYTDWQGQFITSGDIVTYILGVRASHSLSTDITIGLGFDIGDFDNSIDETAVTSNLEQQFFYVHGAYRLPVRPLEIINVDVGMDIGLHQIGGNLFTFSYRELDLADAGSGFAFRPFVRATTVLLPSFSSGVRMSYLITPEYTLSTPAGLPDLNLPFSGLSFAVELQYEFRFGN